MRSEANEVYVFGSARVPFAKSQTLYRQVTRHDLMLASVQALVDKHQLAGKLIDDVALGAVMNSSADFNMAREVVLSTNLDPSSPAYNVQRACGTGLETAWQLALKAHTGIIDIGIAGGVDSNSDVPIEVSENFNKTLMDLNVARTFGERVKALSQLKLKGLLPKLPAVAEPRTKMSMGEHCELMVKEWKITREEQDEIAMQSHVKAAKAYDEGFFSDLVIPFQGTDRDKTLRGDTTVEKLAKLKPAFDKVNGTLTAGNSSPMTDGSAAVLLGNQRAAQKFGLKPLAKFVDFQAAGVDFVHGAGLLMAPTKAVAQLLVRNNLTFADFDYIELHEAFAGQVLCNMKAWESEKYCKEVLGLSSAFAPINRARLNVVGSSLAVGHPFAATGARILGVAAKLLATRGGKRALISICTAGGMGVAAIVESVN